ncbi:unnamed protein product [Malus baccata var. baccata]
MKRKRKSAASSATQMVKNGEHIQQLGTNITDLPKFFIHDVLLKLPTRNIIACKCVCKTWYGLISDPEFTKLHFSQAQPFPMIRPLDPSRVSRTLYLAEPEDGSGFDLRKCTCKINYDRSGGGKSYIHMKLTKYKIPLRNADEVIDSQGNVASSVGGRNHHGRKRKPCIRIRPNHHKYKVVNSCNGFLCLSSPVTNDPVVVCNPITGEFIHLPESASKCEKEKESYDCGFGFNPKTNEYKVLRIFQQREPYTKVAEVHTLGTGSWKFVGTAPFFLSMLEHTTYVKGALFYYESLGYTIYSFDLDTEKFESVPSPPIRLEKSWTVSMGVLGDCLCLCDCDVLRIKFWVLDDHGAQKIWRQKISVYTENCGRWPYGLYKSMNYLKNGALLMFHSRTNSFFYYHPRRYRKAIYLKIRGFKSDFEAISHVPSLISLKDILVGSNVQVLHIHSRCAELRLLGESKALFLDEEIAELASDFNSSDSGGEDEDDYEDEE